MLNNLRKNLEEQPYRKTDEFRQAQERIGTLSKETAYGKYLEHTRKYFGTTRTKVKEAIGDETAGFVQKELQEITEAHQKNAVVDDVHCNPGYDGTDVYMAYQLTAGDDTLDVTASRKELEGKYSDTDISKVLKESLLAATENKPEFHKLHEGLKKELTGGGLQEPERKQTLSAPPMKKNGQHPLTRQDLDLE